MHIFLTNDDGFSAKGIRFLACSLSEIAKITVIAPETEMSSCSGSLSLRKPLYLKHQKSYGENIEVYSLSGTTADCCKLAFEYWLKNDKPLQRDSGRCDRRDFFKSSRHGGIDRAVGKCRLSY